MTKIRPMRLHSGKGKELQDLLCKEFGIPDKAKWFEIRYHFKDGITVTCEYFPPESVEVAE